MKFEQFTNKTEIEDWMKIARYAGLSDEDFVKSEILKSIIQFENKTKNLTIGYAYCIRDSDNKIVGTSFLKQVKGYDSKNQATIFHIGLSLKLRGKGLGKSLMINTFKQAKNLNLKFANLYTTSKADFYIKCGMLKYGEFPNLISVGDKKLSRIYLYINLDDLE